MYASQNYVLGHYTVTDQREVSRHAAERYAQVSAATEGRHERVSARRQARTQRRSAAVATA